MTTMENLAAQGPLTIAIVGRPNVGKSTLFNRLVGRRTALVENVPGVTIDRHYGEATFYDYTYTMIDTGGLDPDAEGDINIEMRNQALLAVEETDIIFLMFDGRVPPTASDEEVVQLIRRAGKPAYYLVNKIDGPRYEDGVYEYHNLGIGPLYAISAEHSGGVSDLLTDVENDHPSLPADFSGLPENTCKVAVIGRPNAGKSTFVNRLLGEARHAVTPTAGTTRDAIDSLIHRKDDRHYLLIDTAGIRRQKKVGKGLEKLTVIKALKAIDRSDVAVILFDAERGIHEQDVKVAGFAHNKGRGCIIVVNKWDKIEKVTNTAREYELEIREKLKFMPYAPVVFISALTGQRAEKVLAVIDQVYEQCKRRVSTGELNRWLERSVAYQPPPNKGGHPLKIYYASQVAVQPPTILLHVNYKDRWHFSYERFLLNRFRETFGFEGTPVRLYPRPRKRKDLPPGD